MIVEVCYHDLC